MVLHVVSSGGVLSLRVQTVYHECNNCTKKSSALYACSYFALLSGVLSLEVAAEQLNL